MKSSALAIFITLAPLSLIIMAAGTPPPTKPPLVAADITRPPADAKRLDLFLLMGQSNMKGRGVMPDEPKVLRTPPASMPVM